MTQRKSSLPSLFSPSLFPEDGVTLHCFRRRREIHRRKLAWMIGGKMAEEQPSNSNVAESFSFPGVKHQDSCWSDIDIAGFQTVLDRQANLIRRLIWLVVLTICFALMLLQTLDRLNYYLTLPVSTTVRVIRNDSLIFPSITLCPYRDTLTRDATHLDLEKLQSLYETNFPGGEDFNDPVEAMYKLADMYDVVTLWKLSGWELENEISSCLQARLNCTQNGQVERIFTVLGYCLHFPGQPVTVSGHFYGFNIKLCNKDNATDKINRFYMMISDRYSTHDIRALTHGFFLEQGWNKEVAVSLKHFQAENKNHAPCSPDQSMTVSRCISQCFHKTLVEKTGCRMPYMNLFNFTSVPYCNTSQQLRLAEDLQKDLLWEGRGWHPASCQCGYASTCSQYLYETSSDTFARHDECAQYKVYFIDMTYEETKEEFAYDIISLLCDIGGTLGLLLGASVLTVIQFVDALSRQIAKWLMKTPELVKRQKSSMFNIVQTIVKPNEY
ncbi:hypothetical protein OUZ56_011135 [Daphnia magna]|uniref:Uncharacterized protein n=2 Tax=Daphnia magna TaxID=35525 RepID=A0ABQ9YZD0_9CRUS|nr:hypothetical protein OUZ56_011135 [Daphnia magna]